MSIASPRTHDHDIEELRSSFGAVDRISFGAAKRLGRLMDRAPEEALVLIVRADIRFCSPVARNRLRFDHRWTWEEIGALNETPGESMLGVAFSKDSRGHWHVFVGGVTVGNGDEHSCTALADELRGDPRKARLVRRMFAKDPIASTAPAFQPIAGDDDPRVVAFLNAWHENSRDGFERSYPNLDYDSEPYVKVAHNRRKYVCFDEGTGGVFMVDKTTGEVWGIKGYGKVHHGQFCGHIEEMTEKYIKATLETLEIRRR